MGTPKTFTNWIGVVSSPSKKGGLEVFLDKVFLDFMKKNFQTTFFTRRAKHSNPIGKKGAWKLGSYYHESCRIGM